MKIAIDCRYIGKSGIGRVCSGIIDELDFSQHEYYLIGNKKTLEKYKGARIIEDETDPYSLKGLSSFDKRLNKICDAMFIPNFLVPFGVKIPVFTIMHDLIFLDIKETTNGFKDRLIKKILLKRCMKKSKAVSCVSKFTMDRCRHYYGKLADKCYVAYNGLTAGLIDFKMSDTEKDNTLVFVGNVKPHKGLNTLVDAFKLLPKSEYRLKIIGEKDKFLTGLNTSSLVYDGIEFTGKLSDEDLFNEVAKAKFLIQPSVYEGFGLPPIEALYLGTKPIVSDIEVFKEVYDGLDVVFFETGNAQALYEKILKSDMVVKTTKTEILNRFSYKETATAIISKISSLL